MNEEKTRQDKIQLTWEKVESEMRVRGDEYNPATLAFEDIDEDIAGKMDRIVKEAKERGEKAERRKSESLMTTTNLLLTQWEGKVEEMMTERTLLKLLVQQLQEKEKLLQPQQQQQPLQPQHQPQQQQLLRPQQQPLPTQLGRDNRQSSPSRQSGQQSRKRYRSDGRKLMAQVMIGGKGSSERDMSDFGDGERILAITAANAARGRSPYFMPDKVSDAQGESFVRWLEENGMNDKGWIQIESLKGSRSQFQGSVCKKCWCITLDRCQERTLCDQCLKRR